MIKLYIIVRTDMASMNAGRTAAQSAHAANYFVKMAKELIEDLPEDDPFVKNFYEWENQTNQGYGTTIVLDGGTLDELSDLINEIENDYYTAMVIDPEYPIQDGSYTHILKDVKTCAFAFPFGIEPIGITSGLRRLNLYGKN